MWVAASCIVRCSCQVDTPKQASHQAEVTTKLSDITLRPYAMAFVAAAAGVQASKQLLAMLEGPSAVKSPPREFFPTSSPVMFQNTCCNTCWCNTWVCDLCCRGCQQLSNLGGSQNQGCHQKSRSGERNATHVESWQMGRSSHFLE